MVKTTLGDARRSASVICPNGHAIEIAGSDPDRASKQVDRPSTISTARSATSIVVTDRPGREHERHQLVALRMYCAGLKPA